MKIEFSENCVPYKHSNDLNITVDMHSLINENKQYLHPKMFIIDNITKIWNNNDIVFTKYTIKGIEIVDFLRDIKEGVPDLKMKVHNYNNEASKGFFGDIAESIKEFLIKVAIFFISLFSSYFTLKYLICKGCVNCCKSLISRKRNVESGN